MLIATGLTDDEVRRIAGVVLEAQLGPERFDHAEARSGLDHDGQAAIFVTAVMQEGSDVIPGDTFSQAYEALDNELLRNGERRFPYFELKWIGDEPLADLTDGTT